ncbi:MAG: hypothetical protein GPOALKHO_001717 [Sodalis sp.]|nr:MAG: hypothetical protein GPOALKHO_001717 [Sodalis sp.]
MSKIKSRMAAHCLFTVDGVGKDLRTERPKFMRGYTRAPMSKIHTVFTQSPLAMLFL